MLNKRVLTLGELKDILNSYKDNSLKIVFATSPATTVELASDYRSDDEKILYLELVPSDED